jgi:hypothetical protein
LVFDVGISICHFFINTYGCPGYYYLYYNHPIIISMFIGQGISMVHLRAAQAERQAANNAMAAASTAAAAAAAAERPSSASPPLFALSPPTKILTQRQSRCL